MLTGIAVEVREPTGLGRCRMRPLADASAVSLHAFVTDHVEPGARVITDGWQGYQGLEKLGYVHQRRSPRAARTCGEDPGELLPRGAPDRLTDQAVGRFTTELVTPRTTYTVTPLMFVSASSG